LEVPLEAAQRLSQLAEMVLWWSDRINLLGPGARARLWPDHMSEGIWLSRRLPDEKATADLGSGGGFPGLVLASLEPDRAFDLFEAKSKKASFLSLAAAEIGLSRVRVHRARVGQDAPARTRGAFGLVVCRATAPLNLLLGPTGWLLRSGGLLMALKGPAAGEELKAARPVLEQGGWVLEGLEEASRFGRLINLVRLRKGSRESSP